ncbi:MAG: hypothetical protein ACRDHF_12900 [Tepidiformaceae bacterium]
MKWIADAGPERWAREKRWLILALVVAVPWVPGAVAVAMLLTGNA